MPHDKNGQLLQIGDRVSVPAVVTSVTLNAQQVIKAMAALILVLAVLVSMSGCVTRKVTTVTGDAATGFSTNTVVTVNTNNLTIDCLVIQNIASLGVNTALNATHNDPGVVNALKNAQTALSGILNGTNPQTTAQVIALLNAQGSPALTQQVTQLVNSLSQVEQELLAKYGAGVAGQISVAITQAVYSGLTVGLAGH